MNHNVSDVAAYVISTIIAGVAGLITVILLVWLSDQEFGRDKLEKHGISERFTSRLGGVAIFFCFLLITLTTLATQGSVKQVFPEEFSLELSALLIGILGLVEDFRQRLGIFVRLAALFFICGTLLLIRPDLMPFLDAVSLIVDPPYPTIVMWPITIMFIVGFINAGNMIDGANGLLSLIIMCSMSIIYTFLATPLAGALLVSLVVFAAFNVLTGKVIMGDSGAYGISAVTCFWCLYIYGKYDVSLWLFASILSYPCVEFSIAIVRRLYSRASIFAADNQHLHNYLHQMLRSRMNANLANSMTGILIATATAAPGTVLFWGGMSPVSSYWPSIFLLEAGLIIAATWLLRKHHAESDRVAASLSSS